MKLFLAIILGLIMGSAAWANHASRSNYHSDYWQDDVCPPTGCID
jgi:hypothetical protein